MAGVSNEWQNGRREQLSRSYYRFHELHKPSSFDVVESE
jgi:hypothetical protein